jgi:hypothetical protein
VQYPIIGFNSPSFTLQNPIERTEAYERLLGGRIGVIVVHGLTAIVTAPVVAEWFMLQAILFLSLYWLCFVWVLSGIGRVGEFLLLRIAESKEGPILGLSALLTAAGAVAKAYLGK